MSGLERGLEHGHMGRLGRVLILGGEAAQLELYASVIQHFWPVTTVLLDEAEPLSLDTDVVVVSATLPEPSRQEWIDRVRASAPGMIVVRVNGFDSGPHLSADATVDETHGPGALVSTIYELLTERGLGSRRWPLPGEVEWVQ